MIKLFKSGVVRCSRFGALAGSENLKAHRAVRFLRRALIAVMFIFLTAQLPAQIIISNNTLSTFQSAVAAGGNIVLAFNGTITTTNPLVIANNVSISPTPTNTATISGGGAVRIFQVTSTGSLTLSNLTISGGNSFGTNGASGTTGTTSGGGSTGHDGTAGAVGVSTLGGAIFNQGSASAYNCLFLTNTATAGSGGSGGNGGNGSFTGGNGGLGGNGGTAFGGAIYNSNILVLSNCMFSGNTVIAGNGGVGGTNGSGSNGHSGVGGIGGTAIGAALYNVGQANIQGCTFDFNFAQAGNSQTAGAQGNGNGATGFAGGVAEGGSIYNVGTNIIINCTFAKNEVSGGGGGNGGNAQPSSFNGGNGGAGGNALGGSLFNDTLGFVALTNCTFANGGSFGGTNGMGGSGPTPGNAGAIGASVGGNIANLGTLNFKNSIVAYPTNALNIFGTLTDQNNNICSDASIVFTQANSFTNRDPFLLALGTNGGPTLTMELQAGSPAIDAIFDGSAPPIDQRGVVRPTGLRPDIGAVEHGIITYNLNGNIIFNGSGFADSGVTMTLISTNTITTVTDGNGNYTFTNLTAGSYNLTPTQTGVTFTPSFFTVSLPLTTASNFNFTAALTLYTVNGQATIPVSGTVYTNLGIILRGSNVFNGINAFNGTTTKTNFTDVGGNYIFTNLTAGSYSIGPQPTAGATFTPSNVNFILPFSTNISFIAAVTNYSVTVNVLLQGSPFQNAVVMVNGSDANGSVNLTNSTDASGTVVFNNLLAGNYTITPRPVAGATFNNSSISINLSSNVTETFTATVTLFNVFGQILLGTNGDTPYAHVTVKASGTNAFNSTSNYFAVTDNDGIYLLANLPPATYLVTPQPAGLFNPASIMLTLPPAPSMSIDFVGLTATNTTLNIAFSPGSPFVRISSSNWIPRLTYRIQASTNLQSWQDVASVTPSTNTLTVPVLINGITNQFFRAVTP